MTLPFTYCQWVRPYALIESDSSSHSISFFSYVKLKSLILTTMYYLQNMYLQSTYLLKNKNLKLPYDRFACEKRSKKGRKKSKISGIFTISHRKFSFLSCLLRRQSSIFHLLHISRKTNFNLQSTSRSIYLN